MSKRDGFARCSPTTASRSAGQQVRARRRWPRRCCWRCSGKCSSASAWPLLASTLPGQSEGFWRSVRDAPLDGFPSAEAADARDIDASLRIQATDNANALAWVDPARLARAALARGAAARARLARRWAITLWPTAAAAQQAGMRTRELEAFVEPALFLDRDDPVAAWGELRAFQAGLIERLAPAKEIRIVGRGHGPAAGRHRPGLDQLRRQAQHALGRGLHRAARALRGGRDPLHHPHRAARRRGRGRRRSSSARAAW